MKRAIVVGASSGIGMEVAKRLKGEGWTIGVAARREERLRELFPDDVAMPIDVLADDAPDQLMALVEALGGRGTMFSCRWDWLAKPTTRCG